MNREEILEAARLENKNKDFASEHAEKQASHIGAAVGALLCMLLMLASEIFVGEANLSCAIVYLGMLPARQIAKYFSMGKKSMLVSGILLSVVTVAGLIVHICELAGVV